MAAVSKKLILVDEKNIMKSLGYTKQYRVKSTVNTVEWDVDDRLDKNDVREILMRSGTHTVSVEIK